MYTSTGNFLVKGRPSNQIQNVPGQLLALVFLHKVPRAPDHDLGLLPGRGDESAEEPVTPYK